MNKEEKLEIIKEGKTGHGLLIENDGYVMPNNFQTLTENMNSNEWNVPKPFIIDCVLQKAGKKNANGRIYGRDILEREVQKYQQKVVERRALGELDHPSDSTISLQKISHNIVELHWEGDTVVGKLELNISEGFRRNGIVSTMGDQAANLILNGYKIGISSRAIGSVEQKLGVLMVGNDLELLGWDIVSDPSTPGAYLGTKESLQQYVESVDRNGKTIVSEKIERMKNVLK